MQKKRPYQWCNFSGEPRFLCDLIFGILQMNLVGRNGITIEAFGSGFKQSLR